MAQTEGAVIWFTGLPRSGKSTLARATESWLHEEGISPVVLDGDVLRQGLCSDLDFSEADRQENIRRIAELAALLAHEGVVVLVAAISPFTEGRMLARQKSPQGRFFEVFCNCPLEQCEQRDFTGLYIKARLGQIDAFTGVSSPYEAPKHPEIEVMTGDEDEGSSMKQIQTTLEAHLLTFRGPKAIAGKG